MMMNFSDVLLPTAVVAGFSAASKKAVFAQIADMAAADLGIDAEAALDALLEREKLGSTGFGGGVALPHGRLGSVTKVTGFFIALDKPVAFDAIDELPVDLVFALLSPVDAGSEHLKALAKASRCLRDRALVAKLRGAGSADAIYTLLVPAEDRDAA